MVCVARVSKSSRFYQAALGCKSGHGGEEYERLLVGERMILQLHAWEEKLSMNE
jgi:hypothetical protein